MLVLDHEHKWGGAPMHYHSDVYKYTLNEIGLIEKEN